MYVKGSVHCINEISLPFLQNSPKGMLTLRDIQTHMSSSYECFRGTYVGWKNSVRHNLSVSDCFVKVLKNEGKPNAKDNFWSLNPKCSHYQLHQSCPLTRKNNTTLPQISSCASSTRKTLSSHGSKGHCKGTAVTSSTPQGPPKCESNTEQFPDRKSSAGTPLKATTSSMSSSTITPSRRVSNGTQSPLSNPSFVSSR